MDPLGEQENESWVCSPGNFCAFPRHRARISDPLWFRSTFDLICASCPLEELRFKTCTQSRNVPVHSTTRSNRCVWRSNSRGFLEAEDFDGDSGEDDAREEERDDPDDEVPLPVVQLVLVPRARHRDAARVAPETTTRRDARNNHDETKADKVKKRQRLSTTRNNNMLPVNETFGRLTECARAAKGLFQHTRLCIRKNIWCHRFKRSQHHLRLCRRPNPRDFLSFPVIAASFKFCIETT